VRLSIAMGNAYQGANAVEDLTKLHF